MTSSLTVIEYREIDGPFIDTRNNHGTGCAFSAALASFLAYGEPPPRAAVLAKSFVAAGLRYSLPVGAGGGPINHMAAFFPGCWGDEQVLTLRETSFNHWPGVSKARPDLGPVPSLYVIVGGRPYQGRDSLGLVSTAVAGGVRLVQLREKEEETHNLVATGIRMREICHDHGALFIVNDRADVAAACGADGVHLGQEDLPPRVARALLGPEAIIGVSVASLEEALSGGGRRGRLPGAGACLSDRQQGLQQCALRPGPAGGSGRAGADTGLRHRRDHPRQHPAPAGSRCGRGGGDLRLLRGA